MKQFLPDKIDVESWLIHFSLFDNVRYDFIQKHIEIWLSINWGKNNRLTVPIQMALFLKLNQKVFLVFFPEWLEQILLFELLSFSGTLTESIGFVH